MSTLQRELKQSRPFELVETEILLNLARTAEALRAPVDALLKSRGLSSSTYNVLRILRGAAGEGLPCREISDRLVTRVPDVTRLLDRLTARGLVERERDTEDRRVVLSQITDEGLTLLDELEEPMREVQIEVLEHMSAEDMKSLSTLLERARSGRT